MEHLFEEELKKKRIERKEFILNGGIPRHTSRSRKRTLSGKSDNRQNGENAVNTNLRESMGSSSPIILEYDDDDKM